MLHREPLGKRKRGRPADPPASPASPHPSPVGEGVLPLEGNCPLVAEQLGRRREPEGYVRADRLFLVRSFRLDLLLPLHEFAEFCLVVQTEIATNCLYQIGQLTLAGPTFGHQIGHHTAWFLPCEVGVLKFCAADVCTQDGEKHRNKRLAYVI